LEANVLNTDIRFDNPKFYNIAWEIDQYAEDDSRVAVYWEDQAGNTERLTYRELRDRSNRFANALKHLGLKKGDRIIILMPRLADTYVAFLGALKAELVISPGSDMLMEKDLLYRFEHSEAAAVICHHSMTERINQLRSQTPHLKCRISVGRAAEGWVHYESILQDMPAAFNTSPTRASDWAFLCYTSGTTGKPKGVMLDHGWVNSHLQLSRYIGISPKLGDMMWSTSSPAWVKWLHNAFINTLANGATGFSYWGPPEGIKYLQLIEKYKINVFCGAATEFRIIAKSDMEQLKQYSLSSLRIAVSAGEALGSHIMDQFKELYGIQIMNGYGQTESSGMVSTRVGSAVKPGAMGKATIEGAVAIVDENGNPVPPNTQGIIAYDRNVPVLFRGYYKDPERTANSFRGNWFMTGDLAVMDEEGYLYYKGRADDVIISAGYTIDPGEVEDALRTHPAVQDCAAVASPDEIRGFIVKAFVMLRANISPSDDLVKELQEHVKKTIAPFKYPRAIEFIDELPRTITGKIKRAELREREMQAAKSRH
jgi:acetyl-CoA synthetase